MNHKLPFLAWLAFVTVIGWHCAVRAADAEAEFTAAKTAIARQLKKKDPAERIAALRRLKDFPLVDAADMLLKVGFKDDDPGARRAAYESLLALKDDPKVCDFLLSQLSREAR